MRVDEWSIDRRRFVAFRSTLDAHYVCVWAIDDSARIKREIPGQGGGFNATGVSDAKQYLVDQSNGFCVGVVLREVHADAHRQQSIRSEARIDIDRKSVV